MTEKIATELELLAPARNTDIGIAAIDCGADAVYIAGPQFGARQAAGNDVGEIRKLCLYAHKFGARVFITLNTILYDNELDQAFRQMLAVQEAGADAIIVQDLAVMEMARRSSGRISIPLHASTQCAIRTPDQARFYEDLGFSRLILERELSLEQIRAIRDAVGCELEFFVHGALCVCYSGQCYMSEAITGRSANRGACAQACRSLYNLVDGSGNVLVRNKALLSLKDFNLRNRISDLADAGITSFKIEGRLKNISYVKNTVRAYSMTLDRTVMGSAGENGQRFRRASFGKVSGGFTPDLDKTFNRGYTTLFIDGKRGAWSTFDSAKGMGEEIGTVSWISPGKTSFRISPAGPSSLNNGDGLSFVARNSSVIGFRADVCNGTEIRCKAVPELFIGARIFRNMDTAFEKELENNTPVREIPVSLDMTVIHGEDGSRMAVTAVSEDGRTVSGIFDGGKENASNQERMRSLFISQLSKSTGIYRFSLEGIHDECGGDPVLPFLPVSSLNAVRRGMAAELDRMPVKCLPLMNRTGSCTVPGISGPAAVPAEVSYKANVSNHISGQVYAGHGAETVEKAFELSHRKDAELMRMKYCIRYELGICPVNPAGAGTRHSCHILPASAGRARLYLENNGQRFPLLFDCAECEMAVLSSTPRSQK